MANPQQLLNKTQQAIQHFKAGQVNEAKSLLEVVCAQKAPFDVAYFLLATIYFQAGDYEKAVRYFKDTVRLNKKHHEAYNNLGVACERLGAIDEALNHYRHAVVIKPKYAAAHFHIANLLQNQNRIDEAVSSYERALECDPLHLKSLNNLALIHVDRKNYESALALLQRAHHINPNDAEVLTNIGYTLRECGRVQESLEYFEKAVAIDADFANAYNNLGVAYMELSQFDKAKQAIDHAVMIDPNNANYVTNLGDALEKAGDRPSAMQAYQKAIDLDQNNANAWNNLGASLRRENRTDEAITLYEKATSLSPQSADIRYNLGVSQLAMGKFSDGWKNYIHRPSMQATQDKGFTSLLPTDLGGKRILVVHDQGIGDELFFLRFAPRLKERGAWLAYLPQTKITPFVKNLAFIDKVVSDESDIDNVDYKISVANLPMVLGTQDNTPLPDSIVLTVDQARAHFFREQFRERTAGPYIGLTWRAGTPMKRILFKEISLRELARAFRAINASPIIVQRSPTADDLDILRQELQCDVIDFSSLNDNLTDMLALLSVLDDYVGVSNTNMHLCAAIGKTARVLLPHPGEWRWMVSGDNSPWFPGFSIYRQAANGDWSIVLTKLVADLQRSLATL